MRKRQSSRDVPPLGVPHLPKPGPFASLRNSFLTGVVISAPLFITFAVLYWFITGPLRRLDGFVRNNIPQQFLPEDISILPGLGVLIAVIFLTVLGIIGKNFIGRSLIGFGERAVDSVPIVRSLYGFFKNVFEMALQQSEQSFKEVALIEYPRPGLWTLCFVVTSTKGEVRHALADRGEDMTNVFVPTTPNPTSGFLLFVPRSELRILDMSVEDGAKKIFSAGLVAPNFDVTSMEGQERSAPEEGNGGKTFSLFGRKQVDEGQTDPKKPTKKSVASS